MTLSNNTFSFFVLSLLFLVSSCRKTSTDFIEKTVLKEAGTEVLEKITKNSAKEIAELGLSKEASKFIANNFDDDLATQFLKVASENKNFINTVKRNPKFLKTWKIFSETQFGSNPNQLSWIHRMLENEKFILKNVNGNVNILDTKTNKLLGIFENDKITAFAGEGGKKLNPLLNIHPLIPNTQYKIGINSTYSDNFGRIEKMTCPLVSKLTKAERSPIQQGLSKKLKDGKIVTDELGNPIRVKAGYYKYSDDGGHLLANIHGGISEQINVLPMTSNANKVKFREIENKISKAILEGKTVKDYTVFPKYTGKSGRPDKFYVSYRIDNEYFSKQIINN
ncbi:DNA/RNA non-specific endonuclease [Flavobacterium sp. FlaQc-30]|uniref:DNA/RNA non-specific endonuclease n=1 Tax=Flavobacterium sp. FlaQc-30 TaxID=3374179 RepID=UPI003757B3C1